MKGLADRLQSDPQGAVEKVLGDTASGILEPRESVRLLFSQYLRCPTQSQDHLANAMLALARPQEMLDLALREYEQFGWGRRWEAAASLLERAGARSWPALRWLIETGRPECEVFVRTVAFLKGVPLPERVDALKRLAANPNKDTREQVLEVLRYFDPADVREVFQVLAQDSDPEIRQIAIEELA